MFNGIDKLIVTKQGLILAKDKDNRQLISMQGFYEDLKDKITLIPSLDILWFIENKEVTKDEWIIAANVKSSIQMKRIDDFTLMRASRPILYP